MRYSIRPSGYLWGANLIMSCEEKRHFERMNNSEFLVINMMQEGAHCGKPDGENRPQIDKA